ncbi:MAG: F0F1 ATP synthase subunit gamma, partial [Myxococcota bacterium]
QSAMTQTATHLEVLPITPPEPEEGVKPTAVSYEFEPSPEEILDRLLPRYVEAAVFNMLLEASASEHSARRRAMKAATDNAEELIRTLRKQGRDYPILILTARGRWLAVAESCTGGLLGATQQIGPSGETWVSSGSLLVTDPM